MMYIVIEGSDGSSAGCEEIARLSPHHHHRGSVSRWPWVEGRDSNVAERMNKKQTEIIIIIYIQKTDDISHQEQHITTRQDPKKTKQNQI